MKKTNRKLVGWLVGWLVGREASKCGGIGERGREKTVGLEKK